MVAKSFLDLAEPECSRDYETYEWLSMVMVYVESDYVSFRLLTNA
jgi:hypothetical protein